MEAERSARKKHGWKECRVIACVQVWKVKAYSYKFPSNLLRVAFAFVVAIFNTFIIVANTFGCKPIAKGKHLRGQWLILSILFFYSWASAVAVTCKAVEERLTAVVVIIACTSCSQSGSELLTHKNSTDSGWGSSTGKGLFSLCSE